MLGAIAAALSCVSCEGDSPNFVFAPGIYVGGGVCASDPLLAPPLALPSSIEVFDDGTVKDTNIDDILARVQSGYLLSLKVIDRRMSGETLQTDVSATLIPPDFATVYEGVGQMTYTAESDGSISIVADIDFVKGGSLSYDCALSYVR